MSIQEYQQFYDILLNRDASGNPIVVPITNEQHIVNFNNRIILNEVPNEQTGVVIVGKYYTKLGNPLPDENYFSVNWRNGEIVFGGNIIGETITVASYGGRGIIKGYAQRQQLLDESNLYNADNVEDFATEVITITNNLDTRVTNIINSNPQPSEIVDARLDNNSGTLYSTIKNRLDVEYGETYNARTDNQNNHETSLKNRLAKIQYFINVMSFGALGDGVNDDTTAIQNAINAAYLINGTVFFPKGIYLVTSLNIMHGITLLGYGATIKQKANTPNWTRMLTTQNNQWNQDYDSPVLCIEGLTFDGNRDNQGTYTGFEKEQSPLVFLVGSTTKAGRLKVIVQNCYFKESVSDGIHVYTNVNAKITNCDFYNCFRGSVTNTGGYTITQMENITSGGTSNYTGIHTEIDTAGYGNSKKVDIQMQNIYMEKNFIMGVDSNSVVLGNNITVNSPTCTFSGANSVVKFTNSLFTFGVMQSTNDRITFPNDMMFENCHFYVTETETPEQNRSFAAINVYWNISTTYSNQELKFINCKWSVKGTIESTDTTYAIYTQPEFNNPYNNKLIIQGGIIDYGFDTGIFILQGGNITIKNLINRATLPYYAGISTSGRDLKLLIDGMEISEGATSNCWIDAGSSASVITHKNFYIDETLNNITYSYSSITSNAFRGHRTIMVSSAPTASTHGLTGDIAILKTPVAGQACEWVCTTLGLGAGAVWKVSKTLSA